MHLPGSLGWLLVGKNMSAQHSAEHSRFINTFQTLAHKDTLECLQSVKRSTVQSHATTLNKATKLFKGTRCIVFSADDDVTRKNSWRALKKEHCNHCLYIYTGMPVTDIEPCGVWLNVSDTEACTAADTIQQPAMCMTYSGLQLLVANTK